MKIKDLIGIEVSVKKLKITGIIRKIVFVCNKVIVDVYEYGGLSSSYYEPSELEVQNAPTTAEFLRNLQ